MSFKVIQVYDLGHYPVEVISHISLPGWPWVGGPDLQFLLATSPSGASQNDAKPASLRCEEPFDLHAGNTGHQLGMGLWWLNLGLWVVRLVVDYNTIVWETNWWSNWRLIIYHHIVGDSSHCWSYWWQREDQESYEVNPTAKRWNCPNGQSHVHAKARAQTTVCGPEKGYRSQLRTSSLSEILSVFRCREARIYDITYAVWEMVWVTLFLLCFEIYEETIDMIWSCVDPCSRWSMLKQWMINDGKTDSISVEEKFVRWCEQLRTDKYVTAPHMQ